MSANDDSTLMFSDGALVAETVDAAEKRQGWKVLIVDDDADVHSVTRLVLADFVFDGRALDFMEARSAGEAIQLFAQHPDIAVALVDVVMETEDAGLRVIRHVREVLKNSFVRLILRTGQPGSAPERDVISQYDINDYKAKTELSALKLYSTMMTALRSYRDIMALDAQTRGMTRMLDVSAALFHARAVPQFAEIVLHEIGTLLEVRDEDVTAFYVDQGVDDGTGAAGLVLASVGADVPVGQPPPGFFAPFLGRVQTCEFGESEFALCLDSRLAHKHLVYARTKRDLNSFDRSLLELFRLKAQAALDNLLLLEKNQAAQRQAVCALARLASLRGGAASGETPPARAIAVSASVEDGFAAAGGLPQGVEFVEFLKQLAIQAEVEEWGGAAAAAAHVERVGRFAKRLAELAGMEPGYCDAIGHAAELHDVGKIFVAPSGSQGWFEGDSIKRALSARHTFSGADFLVSIAPHPSQVMSLAVQIAQHHHETWSGTGYPGNKKSESIPLAARIVAIVDFYDLSTNPIIYGARTHADPMESFELMALAAGYYFDPVLVKLFLRNRHDFM